MPGSKRGFGLKANGLHVPIIVADANARDKPKSCHA
jgi:hypothetical protein